MGVVPCMMHMHHMPVNLFHNTIHNAITVPSSSDNRDAGIQVISRAADILRLLGASNEGRSLGQIAKGVNLPRSTVQRIVEALALEGLISKDRGDHGVRLGPEVQRLARVGAENLRERWLPVMKSISTACGETVDLAILDGDRMRFVDQIVGDHRLRAVSSIGTTFPLTSTANGKAALACLETAEATDLIKSEVQRDALSEDRVATTLADIANIRSGELSHDMNEHTDGICALGFAMRETNGDIYALSVPVPSHRFERVQNELIQHLCDARDHLKDA